MNGGNSKERDWFVAVVENLELNIWKYFSVKVNIEFYCFTKSKLCIRLGTEMQLLISIYYCINPIYLFFNKRNICYKI